MSYTYTPKLGSLKEFLQRIKSKKLGVPDRVTTRYLVSIGYKSSNDRPIVRILQSIEFIDSNGVPTQSFNDFRTAKSKQVMASALRKTYAELFQIYPDPINQSNEDLTNFFAQKEPSKKKGTLQRYVNTFKTLCEFADFGAVLVTPKVEVKEAEKVVEVAKVTTQLPSGVTINLNIQLTLPATEDATVYDKIFKSLKENLLS
ncbi:MAG: DUF5343 domain-containing protein [Candidatus Bathyarchaeota archaeon]|nr:DUF5343 domain-containing protein [Candidatus Bathyarchaeota archaeon]